MLRRAVFLVFLIVVSTTVVAQYDNPKRERSSFGSRDGRFEGSVILAFQTGVTEESEGGSSLDIDSVMGWGVHFGWNWTANWNLSYQLVATKPNYLAVIVPEDPEVLPIDIKEKMSKYSHQFNVTYNFMQGNLTPYVRAGAGWTKLDSNILSGPPTTGCWWDPWWGYICFTDWSTYSTTEFSYNLGVGFRWDINNAIYTTGSYTREFISLDNGTLNFDMAILELGLMF